MQIEFWGDFTCPYTYIGSSNLKTALKEMNIPASIKMNSYELDPGVSTSFAQSALDAIIQNDGMTKEQALEKIASVNAYARESGLPMNFANAHFCDTRPAHRLTCAAQAVDPDLANRLEAALFHENFACGHILSHPDVLMAAARSAGMDEDLAEKVIRSDLYLDEVLAQEKLGTEQPVESIPYFVIDGHVFNSSNTIEGWKEILKSLQN